MCFVETAALTKVLPDRNKSAITTQNTTKSKGLSSAKEYVRRKDNPHGM